MNCLARRILPVLTLFALSTAALGQIILYEHDNFGGRTFSASNSVSNLSEGDFNDRASSAIVRSGQWQLCDDAHFGGQCVTLGPGEYRSLGAMGLNDKVSSLRSMGYAPDSGGASGGSGNWGGAGKLRDTGVCHLANTAAQKVIYNGECRITQEAKDYGALITVRMGQAAPMLFACQRDGSCMTGSTRVRMRDRGNGEASFRWEDFRLDVEAD